MSSRPAYHLGRLLAALAHLKAIESAERLYVQASVAPAAMLPAIGRATATDTGQEILLPIMVELPPDAFDGQLTDEASSDFALGYYHQRAAFRAGRLPKLPEREPGDLDTRYEFRVDAGLKSWVKEHGGDKLIRALLREARERFEANS